MKTLDLFPAFQHHSETSQAAARAIEPSASSLRGRVFAYIRSCGLHGATDEEIQSALSMNPSTQRPRRIELCNSGQVLDAGRKRRTRSGRSAVVWVVGPQA